MIEVRPITQKETLGFLGLLCEVFELDFERAKSVFYSEPFFDPNHKWALFDNGYMLSCLTTTPLAFGAGPAIGIAGVATTPDARHRGLASHLLDEVLDQVRLPAMLFAKDERLYARRGFEVVDEVVRANLITGPNWQELPQLASADVQTIYNAWARQDPRRLIRDRKRWKFWNWHYRICHPVGAGYIATEPGVLRETILPAPVDALPVSPDTEWYGTASMLRQLALPATNERPEMRVMTRDLNFHPEMFLTDQF